MLLVRKAMLYVALNAILSCALLCAAVGQGGRGDATTNTIINAQASAASRAKASGADAAGKALTVGKKFAYDAVQSAVALPQGELQDRLRVLAGAAAVMTPLRAALAKQYSREGLRVEQELIQRGEQPVTSMLSAGAVDCKAVQQLVESITPGRVDAAEPTLVAALGACPATKLSARRLIDAGLAEGKLAPRATLLLMEQEGLKSAWSAEKFEKVFGSLPADAGPMLDAAPTLADLYARAAGGMEHGVVRQAGLRLLPWLGKLPQTGDRTVAVNVTAGAMKQVLGDKEFEEAMASDVMARQVAQSGGEGEISHGTEQPVSVVKAMQSAKDDRMQELMGLAPLQQAKEAAASGFASGTAGERKLSDRYFDLAFGALNTLWRDRASLPNVAQVVEEVSEAAAQVDALDGLRRARGLDDPAAEAIGMIAVARVVAGKD